MKAVVLTLLAVGLALQPSPALGSTGGSKDWRPQAKVRGTGSALQCYSCEAQASNKDCLHVKNCSRSETYCRTERIRAVGVLTVLNKGCSSNCVDTFQDYYLGKKNITCCSTNLCNVDGAHTLQPALVAVVLLPALSGLLLWGPSWM